MGKKRIKTQTEEEVLREGEKIEAATKKKGGDISSRRRVTDGCAYINASYNNTIITITDASGNVLSWASAGSVGFKGTRKSTPFAASRVAETVAEKAKKLGIEKVRIFIKGIGSGRESAIRSIEGRGIYITSIKDTTPTPHNGCRPPKARRV